MKILFLLFPLILLLVQGAAGEKERGDMGERVRGFCSRRSCPYGTRFVGRCAGEYVCCRR
uniref:Beta-defensin-like domain-containing protein n=1 Tax=Zonotrichia albicollis TaxID=44394 RepID=A0A8D2NAP2_ZONAL